jgi:bacteriocin biosynthesis cyclodehydratase domain-containing protein
MAIDATAPDRPQLKQALVRVWRNADTLQVGAGSGALLLRRLTPGLKRLLDLCDGTRPRPRLLAEAAAAGVATLHAEQFLDALDRAGLLEDAAAGDPRLRSLSLAARERLEPERAALSIAHPRDPRTATLLSRRAVSWVEIDGSARVVPLLAALLAAAGIGHVTASSTAEMTAYDAIPGAAGGCGDAAQPRRVADAVAAAVAAAAWPAAAHPPVAAGSPDLRILAERGPVIDPAHGRTAMADGVPVLAVHARELTGVVGPLVVAGSSACLRCLDLHRIDRDDQWPLVAAQLANRRLVQPQPVSLLAILAGYTAAQALAFIDGDEVVATRNGTLELSPPDWRVRRRGWLPHPECGCVWPLSGEVG